MVPSKLDSLENAAVRGGWVKDAFGHYKKTLVRGEKQKLFRLKIQAKSVRLESSYRSEDNTLHWVGLNTCFFSKLVVMPDGRVRMGAYVIGAPSMEVSSL